ncbi:MAG TPA: hypothetical protein VJT09_19070, partial [Pyrinomonadaceae bacterium]|nr:hypothetical protein [Pyrinomonadaceae bacterium]
MEETNLFTADLNGASLPPAQEDSAEVLCAAFSALPDAFYLFDAERILSRVNTAGALMETSGAESLVGRRCCEMFWRVEGTGECLVERAL